MSTNVYDVLVERGFIEQATNEEAVSYTHLVYKRQMRSKFKTGQ